jgi:hypothetical protein
MYAMVFRLEIPQGVVCCSLLLWCFLVAALLGAHTTLEYIKNTISKLNVLNVFKAMR